MILLDDFFEQSRVRVIEFEKLDDGTLVIQLVEREIDEEYPDPNPYSTIVAEPKGDRYHIKEFGDHYSDVTKANKAFQELIDKYT
jgi:hypothetical protein